MRCGPDEGRKLGWRQLAAQPSRLLAVVAHHVVAGRVCCLPAPHAQLWDLFGAAGRAVRGAGSGVPPDPITAVSETSSQPRTSEQQELRQLQRGLAAAAALFAVLLAVGVVGYRVIEPSSSWVDALFMTVITLTTVGYGEVISLEGHPGGKLFTMVLVIVGLGIALYFVSTGTALLVEGHLGNAFWRRRMHRQADGLKGHHIVCGSGETAVHAARELHDVGQDVVVICDDADRLESLRQRLPSVTIVEGDPGLDDVQKAAGVERAAGLVAATENDKENVIVTLTARQVNHELRIVARATDMGMTAKLYNVGADSVVAPSHIGGLRLASELIRPTVVSFLDQMLRDRDRNLRVGEVPIPSTSPYAGKRVADLELRSASNALLLACRCGDGSWVYNPTEDMELSDGVTLILMGTPEDLGKLGALVAPAGIS